jgi:hypothetical protein
VGKLVAPPVETAESTIHFPLDGQFFAGLTESHLEHAITASEFAAFQRDGFVVIPDALTADELAPLTEAVDALDERERKRLHLTPGDMMSRFSVVRFDPAFLKVVAWARTFPKVWDILGWNIQLYISHLVVYPPETWGGRQCRAPVWHQDSGRPVLELERPAPRLSVKIAYWLTDTHGPDRGAMEVIPGSHRLDAPPPECDEPDWDGRLLLEASPGDAVIFDRRLWHRHGKNTSDVVRKALFFGYSYRWLRALDYTAIPKPLLDRCDPVLRQLLGDGLTEAGWYQPQPDDVPLRAWLAARLGEEHLWQAPSRQPQQTLGARE